MANKVTRPVEIEHHGQTHANAQCLQCPWIEQGRTDASVEATKHAKATGHRVKVEKGYSYTIKPR